MAAEWATALRASVHRGRGGACLGAWSPRTGLSQRRQLACAIPQQIHMKKNLEFNKQDKWTENPLKYAARRLANMK